MRGALVRLAVRLLPASERGRYREQWSADLRDATNAGIRRSDIAIGSLIFALTFARPTSEIQGSLVVDRVRYPAALALGGALLSLTTYANITIDEGRANPLLEYLTFVTLMLVAAFGALAPLVGAVVALFRRRVSWRARLGVLLLTASCAAPGVAGWIDSVQAESTAGVNPYFSWGTLAYVAAMVTIAAAWMLVGLRSSPWTVAALVASFGLVATAKAATFAALSYDAGASSLPITALLLTGYCGIIATSLFGFAQLRLTPRKA